VNRRLILFSLPLLYSSLQAEEENAQPVEETTPVLQLTDEQLQEFRELFDAYDSTKSGKIGV
jgi:Ca2+-binding EF-hand superfamily protein